MDIIVQQMIGTFINQEHSGLKARRKT